MSLLSFWGSKPSFLTTFGHFGAILVWIRQMGHFWGKKPTFLTFFGHFPGGTPGNRENAIKTRPGFDKLCRNLRK